MRRLQKVCTITDISQELVRFDTQKMRNPEIEGVEYQQGSLMGYELREYMLEASASLSFNVERSRDVEKWKRECAYCGAKDTRLEIEHIQPRSKGGSNSVTNLSLACHKCNQKKGDKDIKVFLKSKSEILKKILATAKRPLADTAAVNTTRNELRQQLEATGLSVEFGTGGQTKFNRCQQGLEKSHWLDAACVGASTPSKLKNLPGKPLLIKACGFGGRQRCQTNKLGYPVKYRPLRPIHGFLTGDIVRADVPTGKYKGCFTARVCPMSDGRGEFVIDKKRRSINLTYLTSVHRRDGYDYHQ